MDSARIMLAASGWLDLGLPVLDGFEVLRWVRNHPTLNRVLVIVFTSHEDPRDITRAYTLGANSYVLKPHDPGELIRVVQRIESYWLGINTPDPETVAQPQIAL